MQAFTEKAIQTIKNIPSGKVMTYGQIAACSGSPRGARQVARLLHSMSSKHQLPWHRVVNSQGQIVIQNEEARYAQQAFLEEEGIEVDMRGKIDLKRYQFNPPEAP
ncbi:MGMT family protein [Planomicrobium chinense]|uniref:MGMT family protein n=1 Tax=Planococcus chinensis TaxID=272917 RepID=UPI001CC33365|nr:MGMT family protein [Planococcus chinensis]MBZ5200504.1 MGMT family protein [Planococcus chinensis]MCP2033371.1 methylated-DNA-protein-cysteine methyltransferase-like protein [Planomicrobium sp. HSC-17F08]